MAPGASATLIGNTSQCPFCGSIENIPDGTFRATVEGLFNTLKDTADPAQVSQDLLEALRKARGSDDLMAIKNNPRFERFEKWLPNTPEKIAAYIAIFAFLHGLFSAPQPPQNIEYNTFITQYNQAIISQKDEETPIED